tara:strand:+ start:352 stop:516 length:165 start_codon:yes stop_codon:yes gene_type:complete
MTSVVLRLIHVASDHAVSSSSMVIKNATSHSLYLLIEATELQVEIVNVITPCFS